jgi:hypothetical protein
MLHQRQVSGDAVDARWASTASSFPFLFSTRSYWLGTKKPCLTHGLRGITYFRLHVSGPSADLHSGVFGGVVHEPMNDLFQIMSKLTTPKGEILVPGIKDLVAPLTDEERNRYDVMDVSTPLFLDCIFFDFVTDLTLSTISAVLHQRHGRCNR